MEKYIYKIYNTVNNKIYVGQSVDPLHRFAAHKQTSKKDCLPYASALYDAMRAYGVENFHLEIIEGPVQNYNEREKFWIKTLGSQVPNGYNILEGGEDYPHPSGSDCYQAKVDKDTFWYIVEELGTQKTQTEIAEKFGLNQTIISGINLGTHYHDNSLSYPIRKTNFLDVFIKDEMVNRVKFLLKTTQMSLNEIAQDVGCSKQVVNDINQGHSHRDVTESYPIRSNPNRSGKLSDSDVEEITTLLLESKLSIAEIAQQYGVLRGAIISLNTGKSYRRDIAYPIRQDKQTVSKLTQEQVLEIINLLKNTKQSMRSIAKDYCVSHCTIQGINSGIQKTYRQNNISYPIRKH